MDSNDMGKQANGWASKADLAALGSELREELASKSDINRLDASLQRMAEHWYRLDQRMERMEWRFGVKMEELGSRLVGALDAFLGKLEMYGRETATIPKRLDQHGSQLLAHERRIKALEDKG